MNSYSWLNTGIPRFQRHAKMNRERYYTIRPESPQYTLYRLVASKYCVMLISTPGWLVELLGVQYLNKSTMLHLITRCTQYNSLLWIHVKRFVIFASSGQGSSHKDNATFLGDIFTLAIKQNKKISFILRSKQHFSFTYNNYSVSLYTYVTTYHYISHGVSCLPLGNAFIHICLMLFSFSSSCSEKSCWSPNSWPLIWIF